MDQQSYYLKRDALQALLDVVNARGYQCIGPTLHDNCIQYQPISQVTQLPQGLHDQQAPGLYRLQQTDDPRYFAWANGPQALKPYVFASEEVLWRSDRNEDGSLQFTRPDSPAQKLAVVGVRACDIAALYIQDKHFLQAAYKDPYYASRRQHLVIIAVNCTHPADTCFCASTGDGPCATYGYDVALTEITDGFLIDARSQFGTEILQQLPIENASATQIQEAGNALSAAARQQRHLPAHDLNQALFANLDHPQWADIAKRCLSCGNCTSVCPTCFCHSESDRAALDGKRSDHVRLWDSCFNAGHSYIHGITIRATTTQRYRQWLTHKLGSWHDQYGRSGCVGCGRCISWCPVGIDLTREVAIICGEEQR
ncbi:MAG: sulfite reductase subunit A [Gammaproteobacteria bacterium]|nr:sulfite reductase subunit A [Gammaproteobacteria bacterium]